MFHSGFMNKGQVNKHANLFHYERRACNPLPDVRWSPSMTAS